MENDNESEVDNEFDNNIFKLEYKGQNVENNIKYKKWRKKKLDKYNNNIKIFNCSREKILFFTTKNLQQNYYLSKCPSCQKEICYFCSRYCTNEMFYSNCCLKRGIYSLIFAHGFNSNMIYISNKCPTIFNIKIFFIPYIFLPLLIKLFYLFFFYGLPKKDSEDIGNGELIKYGEYFEKYHIRVNRIITFIFNIFKFVLPIPYILIDIYFHIFLILISIPFKGLPIILYSRIIFRPEKFCVQDLFNEIYCIKKKEERKNYPSIINIRVIDDISLP